MEQKKNKTLSKKKLMQYFAGDVGKGLFTGMIVNYIIVFYTYNKDVNPVQFLPDVTIWGFFSIISFILLISKVVDAITDPIVANWTDKSKNPKGRRIPIMRMSAIPYALSALLVYMAPFSSTDPTGRTLNAVWVALFIVAYYTFYTMYSIPHRALIPEIIPDPNKRVFAYTISTVFFMGSSSICYLADGIARVSTLGYANTLRIIFGVFTVIGLVCLLISAYSINEKDYLVETAPPTEPFLKSFKLALKNRDFMIITIGDLFNYMAMAFFQSAMFFYISDLLHIKQTFVILGIAIFSAICLFPLIMKQSKVSKKKPILIGSAVFAVLFILIYFADKIVPNNNWKWLIGVIMGVAMAYPFAAINILPQSMVSDVIQLDRLRFGENKEGIYAACKTFLEKMSYAIAGTFVGSVIYLGSTSNPKEVTTFGLELSGLIAGIFAILSFITFLFYNDKGIMKYIHEHKPESRPKDEKILAKAEKITFIDKFVISDLTIDGKEKKASSNIENHQTFETEVKETEVKEVKASEVAEEEKVVSVVEGSSNSKEDSEKE